MLELSDYDLNRKPKEVLMDEDTGVSPRSCQRELICPICLDILNQTMTTRECLHRFCSDCINKALRSGNKECPTCRKRLTSRRCLRSDPSHDKLIAELGFSREQEKSRESFRVITARDCEIILRPINGKSRYIKCPHETTIDHLSKYLAMRPSGPGKPRLENNIDYRLCILENFEKSHYQQLDGGLTLDEVRERYSLKPDRPVELYYYDMRSNAVVRT